MLLFYDCKNFFAQRNDTVQNLDAMSEKNRQNGVLCPNFFQRNVTECKGEPVADEPTSSGEVSRKSVQRRRRKSVWEKLEVIYNDRT